MASIREEAVIDCSPDDAWEALRDWGALHTRLAPGFVIDTRSEGAARIVTFSTGAIVREVLVDLDDDARRLAWSIVDGPYAHHNGVAQVIAEPDGRTRFVWVTDLLPNELAARTAQMMAAGTEAITRTLGRAPTAAAPG